MREFGQSVNKELSAMLEQDMIKTKTSRTCIKSNTIRLKALTRKLKKVTSGYTISH